MDWLEPTYFKTRTEMEEVVRISMDTIDQILKQLPALSTVSNIPTVHSLPELPSILSLWYAKYEWNDGEKQDMQELIQSYHAIYQNLMILQMTTFVQDAKKEAQMEFASPDLQQLPDYDTVMNVLLRLKTFSAIPTISSLISIYERRHDFLCDFLAELGRGDINGAFNVPESMRGVNSFLGVYNDFVDRSNHWDFITALSNTIRTNHGLVHCTQNACRQYVRL